MQFEALQRYAKRRGRGYFSIPLSENQRPKAPLEGLLYSNGVVNHMVLGIIFAA